jgi:hypothetical protein
MSLDLQRLRVQQAQEAVKELEYQFEAAYANHNVAFVTVFAFHQSWQAAKQVLQIAQDRYNSSEQCKRCDPYP